jgi:hypothetical protein
MVWVDVGILIYEVSAAVIAQIEECVIWLEHCFGQFDVEISCQTTGIDALLVSESDSELAPKLIASLVVQKVERFLEDVVTVDCQPEVANAVSALLSVEFLPEVLSLVVKVKQVGHVLNDIS